MSEIITDVINHDDIVSFYISSYLCAISDEPYYQLLLIEYAHKSIKIFKYALDWELLKAHDRYHPEDFTILTANNTLNYIRNFPDSLYKSTQYLGPNWLKIAELIFGANDSNIIHTVDSLVDMDHNNGNVLCRILSEYRKYSEFITAKAYAEDIRELLLFTNDTYLTKAILKSAKEYYGNSMQDFEDNFMKLVENRHAKILKNPKAKAEDLQNAIRLLKQVTEANPKDVIRMMKNNTYAWSGLFTDVDVINENIFCSEFDSGQFINCCINNSTIVGGLYKNCIFVKCNVKGSPVIIDSVFDNSVFLMSSSATVIKSDSTKSNNYSDKTSFIDCTPKKQSVIK